MIATSSLALRDPAEPTTWRIALHEAGHAVCLSLYRLPFTQVHLTHPCTGGGAVAYSVAGARAKPLAFIVTALAGSIAAAGHTGTDPLDMLRGCGSLDLDTADQYSDGLDTVAVYRLVKRAEKIVLDTHRDAVHATARALLEPPQMLTAAQVAELVDDHHPSGLGYLLRQVRQQLSHDDRSTT